MQDDKTLLNQLFILLTDRNTANIRQRELILFLKELCTFAQALQPPGRDSFFKRLNALGILKAIEVTLQSEDAVTKTASIDVLLFVVEFSPSMVREDMLQQLNNAGQVRQGISNVFIISCDE